MFSDNNKMKSEINNKDIWKILKYLETNTSLNLLLKKKKTYVQQREQKGN